MKKITVIVKHEITVEQIKDLLYSAAQGAQHWCDSDLGYENEVSILFKPSGKVRLYDSEAGKRHWLTFAKIKRGLELMAKNEPEAFADIVGENADMYTGDTFLQFCVFGKEVYS